MKENCILSRAAKAVLMCLLLGAAGVAMAQAQSGNIDFDDSNVRSICVNNWDGILDGITDGKLSYAEAAAVTNLSTVFRDNTSIRSFRELRYFTGLTLINSTAFSGCTSLTQIDIPANVTKITGNAFRNCTSLTYVSIPSSVTTIEAYAFYGCSTLTSINFENSTPPTMQNTSFDGVNANPNVAIFVPSNSSLTTYQNATALNGFTVFNVNGEIFFESSAPSIKSWDVNDDGKLTYAEAHGVTNIGTFRYSRATTFDELQYFTGLTSIGYRAFYYSKITTVIIPNSVTTIAEEAFYHSKLASIIFPPQLRDYHREKCV